MHVRSERLGNTPIELSRITVFLGANGSGKSSVLNAAKGQTSEICPGKKAVYIEGGRAITLKNSLELTRQNFQNYNDYNRAKATYERKRQDRLSDRVYDALMVLERKELAIKAAHSDAVQQWHAGGRIGDCPARETPPLERLFSLFHEVFPRLQIRYDPNGKRIAVQKGAATYAISEMSDGEKQVFSILADFIELGPEYGIVVVDEPELNLHPELAERIWSLIESEFPELVYCYATHCLSFAMRPQVERVVVLSDDPTSMTVITDRQEFTKLELQDFLGSIPGIIAANDVLVTEGHEKSFDSVFFRWLLRDDQVEIMPVGDREQVVNVCRRNGIWAKIATKVSLVGVVDRDFRADAVAGEVTLEFREAESYLGIPALVVAVDSHLGIKERRIAEGEVVELLMGRLEDERHLIVGNRVAAECGIRLGVSVERSALKGCTRKEELLRILRQSSQSEVAKAQGALGEATVDGIVEDAYREIDGIRARRDWAGALRYLDGKGVAHVIASRVGLRNAIDLMRAISASLSATEFEAVLRLSQRIQFKRVYGVRLSTGLRSDQCGWCGSCDDAGAT